MASNGLRARLRHFADGAHRWALDQGIPKLFLKIADDRDFTFIAKMNLVGERNTKIMLDDLDVSANKRYRQDGIVISAYNPKNVSYEKRRVHFRSKYADKLQLLYTMGYPPDELRFMYAVAQVRNAYLHELEHLEKRILDVVISRFSLDESRNAIDALMYKMDSTLGGFLFEGPKPTRGNYGSYIDFHGKAANRRMNYSAMDLKDLGKMGVNREVKTMPMPFTPATTKKHPVHQQLRLPTCVRTPTEASR